MMPVLELTMWALLSFCPKGQVCVDPVPEVVLSHPELCEDEVRNYQSALLLQSARFEATLQLRDAELDLLTAEVEGLAGRASRRQKMWIAITSVLVTGLFSTLGWAIFERNQNDIVLDEE